METSGFCQKSPCGDDIQFLFIQLLGVNLYAPNTDADRSAKVAMISIMVW
jgi:hypothetical protein